MTIADHSVQSWLDEDDRRRLELINDPNYGIILSFLDRFRDVLGLPHYPLQLFEDHLLNYQGQNSSRLIDFHFILLKRLSLAKRAQRDNFDSIITRFASRFDINDSEHLAKTGYLQSDIHVKIRTIKNILESQLDLNQTLRKTLINKSSWEIKSLPFGRDRFGVSYWLFMDNNCFVRLFREDIDNDRTWTNVAKNRDEFENFIKLLISDFVIQKKFPDWTIDYEPFSCLSPSIEYEKSYSPISINVNEEEEQQQQPRTRSGKKRNFTCEESSNEKKFKTDEDESTSVEDLNFITRSRKQKIIESSSDSNSQLSDTKKKVSLKTKTKTPSRRRRRKISSTSSSDEHIDYSSEDDSSQTDTNDPFFEFDDDNSDEPLRPAKTAQTSITQTSCYVCLKNDRPEVLLLCDGCDDGYHLECLSPMLFSIPDGDWFCPLCEHKKLSNGLIEKLKELLMNYEEVKIKQTIRTSKQFLQRKIKIKEYSSDESITMSESEHEESILSTSQSNLSFDENNISQHGRHRHALFDMKTIFENFNTDFDVQLPKKITRLLHRRRHRSLIKTASPRVRHRSSPITTDLNDNFDSPLSNEDSSQMKTIETSSKQTSGILRRWNDVKRRSRLKAMGIKVSNEIITSDCTDDNSNFCLDDTSQSIDSHTNDGMKDEDSTSIRSKGNLVQSTFVTPIDGCSSRNGVKKMDGNFDRLTRDIQFAVNDTHILSSTTKTIDQQPVKPIQKKFVSLYKPKGPSPLCLPTPSSNIFKSSNTPTSPSSLTAADDQTNNT